MKRKQILAAGLVAIKAREGKEPHVLLVHRPAYNDWTLPKGKIEPWEYLPDTAVRETYEEAGAEATLGAPLPRITYPVGGGTKAVYYWVGNVQQIKRRKADDEVDKVSWVTPTTAYARMSYEDEKATVAAALAMPPTVPFLVVRHAKAMLRKHWTGRDQARPITSRGRRQSQALIPLLAAYGVTSVASSTSIRCMQTLQPYAKQHRLDVHGWATLSEEIGEESPKDVTRLMKRLVREAVENRTPTAICGHRPVLPTMLKAIGITPRPMQAAAAFVAHLDADANPVAVEFHRPML